MSSDHCTCYFSFIGSPSYTEGRCPGSKAPIFNRSNFFATAPVINLHGNSFTISCWVKKTEWGPDRIGIIYGDWNYPRQFLLSAANQSIVFQRQNNESGESWSLQSTTVSLSAWTHVVVTWHHATRTVLIYANGKVVGNKKYSAGETFNGPTGKPYIIGNDVHGHNHQFNGSVMDLHVFERALSLQEINLLRGVIFIFRKSAV